MNETDKKVIVVDSLMGSGKTTWCKRELLENQLDKNFLLITPYLDEVESLTTDNHNYENLRREMVQPKPMGMSKLDNFVDLLNAQFDIASTHELFRRFDDRCKDALRNNNYTLILDESLTAVEPYVFTGKQDFEYLVNNHDITVDDDGAVCWVGSELNTRFDDVRILAKNRCLFKVDDEFFLWHFPHDIFNLFDEVYILTYMFEGSLMKYYHDMMCQYKNAIADVNAIKAKYTTSVNEIETLKRAYKNNMDRLLSRIRKGR